MAEKCGGEVKAMKWLREGSSCIGSPQQGWGWGKVALAVMAGLLVLALLSKWSGESHRYPRQVVHKVKSLVQESIRWNATATQDSNQILALMHSTHAIANLTVARHLVPDNDIVKMVGIQPQELMHELQERQNATVQLICKECPQLQPASGRFTGHTGWMA